ncbi:unnamed protein product [Dovyalis caffra]|uniref:Ataxin-10 domain-containing protein n=1 Tax=Dovyalis caffra TaxID=77055 RepID=A0AAV1RYB5_9ROSI|nr:unnamed protein product [Dovyalis caffra]
MSIKLLCAKLIMAGSSLTELSYPQKDFLEPLFTASKSCDLKETLETLIEFAKTDDGRADLGSKLILPVVLQLITHLLKDDSGSEYLSLSLRLIRNLCAGEVANQKSFIELNGVEIFSTVLRSKGVGSSEPDFGIIRIGLQVLANVSLAGKEHQQAIWGRLFHDELYVLAKFRSQGTCDPLCMIIYACCDGSPELVSQLCGDQGLPIVAEIIRTASLGNNFGLFCTIMIVFRICLEDIHFPRLFSRLYGVGSYCENAEEISLSGDPFLAEQAYLLNIVSEILNERLKEITILNDFALCILEIFKKSVEVVEFGSRGESGLPTGSAVIDVLGYSLTILRDICASNARVGIDGDLVDVVDKLLSSGLLDLLLCLLRDLEPPAIIRKAMKQANNQEATSSYFPKFCPYKGFRRDLVAVIGNCAYQRKHVQDDIRQKNGMLLMLQQAVIDEDNPFLREWGIWSLRNLLEGNSENQQAVAELELQGSVDMPELAGLGLRVEVDQNTRRPKLVNIS